MKVVLDENVSKGLAQPLRELGFTILAGPAAGTDDASIFRYVLKEQAVLVTRDYHFTNPIRFDAEKTQGIIYIHHGNLTSAQEISLVVKFLRKHPAAEFQGKLVTLYANAIRIR